MPVAAEPSRQLTVTGAGRALARITSDPVDELMPSISPSGDVVLFETRVWQDREIAQQTVIGVAPDTGAMRTLYTSGNAKASWPTWMPDGSALVFASDASGRPSLVKSLAAQPNAAVTVIVGGDAAPVPKRPTISPDGQRVAFQTEIRGKSQIAVVGIDGSRLTILGEGQRPAWSPDGRRLAFSRHVGEYNQLFLINADSGTNLVQLTNDFADNDNPAWSPNGKLIVFNSNRGWDRAGTARDAVWNLFAIKTNGTGLLQLTDGDSDTGGPCWGRMDGSTSTRTRPADTTSGACTRPASWRRWGPLRSSARDVIEGRSLGPLAASA
ncbi:tolB protein precursor [Minicystis rosea]|nr:tolB protein precursor [Minicystis rosea]